MTGLWVHLLSAVNVTVTGAHICCNGTCQISSQIEFVVELQAVAELFFGISRLKVLKLSNGGNSISPVIPRNMIHYRAFPIANPAGLTNGRDVESDSDDDEDEDDNEQGIVDDPLAWHAPPGTDIVSTSVVKLLKGSWRAALIHNHSLQNVSLINMLEGCMEPKDARRIYSWMDFCCKRNLMEPRLLKGVETFSSLPILTETIDSCWDNRKSQVTKTGLSLHYHCLRNRPDALVTIERVLALEKKERQEG